MEIKSAEITLSGNATVARYLAEKYSELIFPSIPLLLCACMQAVAKQ